MKRLTRAEGAVILDERLLASPRTSRLKNTVVVDQQTDTWGDIEHVESSFCGSLKFKLAPETGGESLAVTSESLVPALEYIESLKGQDSTATLNIKTFNGEALRLETWPNSTGRVLKELISLEIKRPAASFRLVFGEEEFSPDETLRDAGIEDDATLSVMMVR